MRDPGKALLRLVPQRGGAGGWKRAVGALACSPRGLELVHQTG